MRTHDITYRHRTMLQYGKDAKRDQPLQGRVHLHKIP
jgi:hypothetical protein